MPGDREAVGLTAVQKRVLKYALDYGPGIDFGGSGALTSDRTAARLLIELGFMSGSYRSARITDLGRRALADMDDGRGEVDGDAPA